MNTIPITIQYNGDPDEKFEVEVIDELAASDLLCRLSAAVHSMLDVVAFDEDDHNYRATHKTRKGY